MSKFNILIFTLLAWTVVSVSGQPALTSRSPVTPPSSTTTISPHSAPGAACSKRCDFGWVNFGDKCVKAYYIAKSFAKAYNICRDDYQGRLLTIQSLDEQRSAERLLIETAGGNGNTGGVRWIWLGAVRCPHTGFYWLGSNGTQMGINYSNWEVNQPDSLAGRGSEACIAFQLSSQWTYGKWHDIICDHETSFICERSL